MPAIWTLKLDFIQVSLRAKRGLVNRKRETARRVGSRLLFRLSLLALSSFNEIPIRLGETRIACTAFGTGLLNIVHCKKPPPPFKCEAHVVKMGQRAKPD